MERIRERLRKLKQDKHSEESLPPPPPPILPDERPRPLTAAPCAPAVTANSVFFQRVPPEIRRRILVEAFGARTLHLDLRLEHPLRKGGRSSRSVVASRPQRHANAQLFHPSLRDATRPREWTWWSCVCHHADPSIGFDVLPPGIGFRAPEPALDACRDPLSWPPPGGMCEYYPGPMPGKCFIGVLPWLLTCRAAYVEGIDVLYATNRFHMEYAALVVNLPRLLTPSRLAAIRQVELTWSLAISSSGPDSHWASGVDGLEGGDDRLAMLSYLPKILPNLRYLYLSLRDIQPTREWKYAYGGQDMYDATEEVLHSIDTMVVRLTGLRDCRVALPTRFYATRKQLDKAGEIARNRWSGPEPDVLWRSIDFTDAYTEGAANDQLLCGYWIVHGYEDMQQPVDVL
ncbi:hypothetical protein PG994_010518 [Apiospora phragmitis]|uniref:DUF7730 domain-containing protein n=1 Tax=Apiospora phragmitis TaxID=2905665 RepID=A0ABR1TQD3_9PEZI